MVHRLNICDTCPHKRELSPLGQKLVRSINDSASIFECSKCNCPLAAKTAATTSKCPLNPPKWDVAGTESMY
jgi:microsomal dipeptidase-like Zn-dependent dipeptidase